MATFPVIYRHGTTVQQPEVGSLDDTMAHDPVVRSQSEGGYVTSRARFTRISRRWTVRYTWMTREQAKTNVTPIPSIKTFEDARVGGSESFTWTNPSDSTAYSVRFLGAVRYVPHAHTNFLWWTVEFVLEQV